MNTSGTGVPSNPPMSWLQKPNPLSDSDSPPRSDSAIASKDDQQSPPQCTGYCWPPAVAERAKTTASPCPRSFSSSSNTVRLYRCV